MVMPGSRREELLENWPRRGADVDSSGSLLCAAGKEEVAKRGTLLEDWPKRESTASISSFDSAEAEDDVTSASIDSMGQRHTLRDVHVEFAKTSQLYVYERESKSLLRSLSYTKKDYEEFGKEAMLEGLQIKNTIATAPHASNTESIKHLLQHDIVSKEDLVGLEHVVLGKPSTVLKMRKLHAASVLLKQQELTRRKLHAAAVLLKQQELQHQQAEDLASALGEFAQSSSLSLGCTKRAQVRAEFAASI